MMKPLSGTKIAVLVANGFDEKTFLAAQKMMVELGASLKIVSTNQGLVNGWDGDAWGHNYAVDVPLNTALGVDYDALIIPGGRRSLEKMKMTAHTRRFIGSFMAASKPVAVMDDAIMLMALCEQIMDKKVTGPQDVQDVCTQSGAHWMETILERDNNLLSGLCDADHMTTYFDVMRDLMAQAQPMSEAA